MVAEFGIFNVRAYVDVCDLTDMGAVRTGNRVITES